MNFKKIILLLCICVSQQSFALSAAPFVPPGAELLRAGKCEEFEQVFAIADAKETYRWDGLWADYFNRLSIPKRIECLNNFEVLLRHRLLLASFNTELLKAWYVQGGDLNLVKNSRENLSTLAAEANNLELLIWLNQSGVKPMDSTQPINELTASSKFMGAPSTRLGRMPQELRFKVYDWLLANNYNYPTDIPLARELLLNLSKGYFKTQFKDGCKKYKKIDLLETIITFERNNLLETNSSKYIQYDSLRQDFNTSMSKFFVYKLKNCDLYTNLE
jgi:hypothetical protein